VAVAEDDWRLRGQEEWLANRPLRWARWTPYRDGWDHDHCEFCWAEISTLVGDHADAEEGYVTADDSWICSSCFVDFHDRMQWTVIDSEPGERPGTAQTEDHGEAAR